MNVLQNDFATLPDGAIIELKGKDIAMVRWVRDMKPAEDAPQRKDGTPARGYSHFAVGGRGFTIDDQSQDDIDVLKDKNKRKTLSSIILEASSYDAPVLGEDLQPIEGETERKLSFRFVTLVTAEDAKAYVKTEGEVAQEEAKWAPKVAAPAGGGLTEAKLGGIMENAFANVMKQFMAMQAPAAAPAPAPVAEHVS